MLVDSTKSANVGYGWHSSLSRQRCGVGPPILVVHKDNTQIATCITGTSIPAKKIYLMYLGYLLDWAHLRIKDDCYKLQRCTPAEGNATH